jgi:outer membrane murein-binding lipoprotein Lpp
MSDWLVIFRLCALAAVLLPALAAGAEPNALKIEQLKSEMRQLREQMDSLERELDALEAPPEPPTAPAPAASADPSTSTGRSWSPAQPLTLVRGGSAYLNLSLDMIANVGTSTEKDVGELELGEHDPDQRGFSLRNVELALDGAVDPYFQAFANVVFLLDKDNETSVELEEAYGLTTSLPWNLQAKGGQFLAEFGRHNPMHPHAWQFVDEPLVAGRLLGGDGLRNVGARLSWLVPAPFYTEVLLAVLNGEGETASSFRDEDNTYGRTPVDRGVSSLDDLLYVPRVTGSVDVTESQTVVLGASGAFGANDTGGDTDTQIYGADLYWKWRPERAVRGFPFVAWQSEAMVRRYEAGADPGAGLPSEVLKDWGFYSQLVYGFRVAWTAALRGEFVSGDSSAFDSIDPEERADRTRVSPNLSWYPSEFSRLRLQYNYDYGQEFGSEHSVWLQTELLLGAHGAHKF